VPTPSNAGTSQRMELQTLHSVSRDDT